MCIQVCIQVCNQVCSQVCIQVCAATCGSGLVAVRGQAVVAAAQSRAASFGAHPAHSPGRGGGALIQDQSQTTAALCVCTN